MLAASPQSPADELPPPPRKVTGLGGTLWSALGFMALPHVWMGVGLMGYTALTVLWLLFGAEVNGRVVSHRTYQAKGRTTYSVTYGWRSNGTWRSREDAVPAELYASLTAEPAHAVEVREFSLGPFERAELEGVRSPIATTLIMLGVCGFWNGVMFLFVRAFVLLPRRWRLLVRDGFATPGIVTARDQPGSLHGKFRVTYDYEDKLGRRRSGAMFFNVKARAHSVVPGQRVTVLHDLERPERSVVYELSGVRVAGR